MLLDYELKHYNIRILLYMLLLSGIGVMAIYSATNQNRSMMERQIVGALVGLALAVALSLIDYHRLMKLSPLVYVFCIGLLVATLLTGNSSGIARRWLVLPAIGQIQPSEFVKAGLVLFFSWLLTKLHESVNRLPVLALIAAAFALPAALIVRQPNLSTVLVMTVMMVCLVFVAGLGWRWICGIVAVLAPVVGLAVYLIQFDLLPSFLQPYQINRIKTWLNKEGNAELYYQQENSIMAIGSGQLWGKGFNTTQIASVKNGNFLSVEESDFIFAIIGEELGFVGCVVVICLTLLLVYECLMMAGRSKDLAGRLFCAGMGSWIAFQSFTNIAVATGVFPNTGLPLPFISYGVSSLLSLYIGMGVVLNVSLQRKTNERDEARPLLGRRASA
ncbi:MAG: rod shape-determining protein RodA [Lachnospiraceae bacterium]|jgi:rod shape determining protein RodA|nr:rod shape-determining protein RodA [Lachnospiraceae bacterium]